jgi:hypothetical protein
MSLKIDNKQHRDFKVDSDQSLIATVAIILTNIYIKYYKNKTDFPFGTHDFKHTHPTPAFLWVHVAQF